MENILNNDIGIYKITNMLNQKSYIGQSIHIQRRWREHITENTNSAIHAAINKYGIENFTFEVLEYCSAEQLDELEMQYIQKYNTIAPHGYNISTGGQSKYEHFVYIPKETVDQIIQDLLTTSDSIFTIASRYNVSFPAVDNIRLGTTHKRDNLVYPLRNRLYSYKNHITSQQHYCKCCGTPITRKATTGMCMACYCKTTRVVERPSKEALARELYNSSFLAVGRKYGVTDNAVRK